MDSSKTVTSRRQETLIAGLAVALIFVSGILQGTIPFIATLVGSALAVIGWAYAVFIAGRSRQAGWIVYLVICLLVGLALAAYAYVSTTGGTDLAIIAASQLGFFFLAFVALSYGTLGGAGVVERGMGGFYGGWGLLSLVIGGTLVGGAIGTSIGAGAGYITAMGFRLYAVAGVLGLIAWIFGLIVSFRTRSWGWFTVVVLLPGIGAFMFGLFGPTRQDVLMAQENARQRKAVGLG